jgi:hypothetical protein
VGVLPGGILFFSAFCSDDCLVDSPGRFIAGLVLSLAGLSGGTALGIVGGASLVDGQGSYWPTVAGTALGTLSGIVLAIALLAAEEAALIPIPIIVSPVIGGMIGYELSHSSASERTAQLAAPGTRILPVISVHPSGGILGGLVGSF